MILHNIMHDIAHMMHMMHDYTQYMHDIAHMMHMMHDYTQYHA